ncbi:MAG: efflux RND transporter permease subunit [Nitrospirae bacterium]|uniref:Cation/multidrug efflux pump n=3 Tax=Nitrospirota TaxID=40117 RepID=A0A142BU37_9BACT|nr:cation/multidrug efflux pump [Candidatus Magnetobacterium casensis]AMP41625.1 cation/multidrug efflux pump [uncultured Nitrospirota bacterium]MBF0337232.1 efflux RND transporter permease subunit [Nitrospirota bacterium]
MQHLGISGKIASSFIKSKLTPLIVFASLLMGLFAVSVTPREEEPQIVVPMFDVMVSYPGASAREMEQLVTYQMEKVLSEITGVEFVYSVTRPGFTLAIVRFYVGEDTEKSSVKLHQKLAANFDKIPAGVSRPLIKPKSIDEVPIVSLTLSSDEYSAYQLRSVAMQVADEIKKDNNVAEIYVTGGQTRQLRVTFSPERLKGYGLSPLYIINALKNSNVLLPSGVFQQDNVEYVVETGKNLQSAQDVKDIIVGVHNGSPVYLRNVADVTDGPGEPSSYVFMGHGARANHPGLSNAVTIALAKTKGSNATTIAEKAIEKIEHLKGWLIPNGINVTVTRDYGETAKEKSDSLLEHLFIATFSVILLIAFTLGFKESIVVAVAVPVTLALTLLINYLFGYTLNRVTLFSLIFSIGILVDDAIVVVENIHRHFKLHGASVSSAVAAVDEVGNPTILATFAVIAALMPMAFVSGLMGPYMRPIPVGASSAMIFSLLIAFIVTPWMGYMVLKNVKHDSHNSPEQDDEGQGMLSLYEKIMKPLLEHRLYRYAALLAVLSLLGGAVLLLPLKLVTVKMLPFDNKSELQVIIDMPEGATLEKTAEVTRALSEYIKTVAEVMDFQLYIGTSAPFNFNGLVRHYYMRQGANMADIQINLLDKSKRTAQSHDIAKRIRAPLGEIAARYGANIKIAEIPPGPPVMSTLVAEVYGPDTTRQIEIARDIMGIFKKTDGVVDVDWMLEDDQVKYVFETDMDKASRSGVSAEAIAGTMRTALNGMSVGLLHSETDKEPVEVVLQAALQKRSGLSVLEGITVPSQNGTLLPLMELVRVKKEIEDKTIYHKNLRRVTYVTADVAGKEESPAYVILKMKDVIKHLKLPEGYELKQYFSGMPWLDKTYSMKWDGEWQITYDVFRDMGIAFAVVLILIYVLVVGWFKNFITPLIIMAPIPLTLVGILPGHWMMGAFFTATSMIGFIALAGIIVRNSILLVDFIQVDWNESGNLKDAIIKAGAVRFRPIALTALAVLVGSLVMLFDPIFQGLAISMMTGAVVATLLTLIAVPLLFYEFYKNRKCPTTVDEC